ncbi:iron-containing redox enzyme family protein [Actinomadura rugatobispora]|uniref:Iron-containing redox enzyme family protein n=1 Tax=Actinomadura rugatobispora TaxID=1994 RepID=A0ABW1A7B5_9ACTN|nr:iron-containing redox enzyme family protein [Actinomadura rugatobispora]
MTDSAVSETAPHPAAPPAAGPALPEPRGQVSEAIVTMLARSPSPSWTFTGPLAAARGADPFGDDLHLALHVCYELHYQGFEDVDPAWEWDPSLLELRGGLERTFVTALRDGTPGGGDVDAVLDDLLTEPADAGAVPRQLRRSGEWWQLREYLVHRSIYHLKEADPHAWVLPRLRGRAKAALVAVEFDEFGGGRAERMHSRLFADLMEEAGLDPAYGAYADVVTAPMLAITNMMSLFGLHRSLRGALVGHFAAAEITTAPSARRFARVLRHFGVGERGTRFFTEHIEADAVHEQVLRRDVVGNLLATDPHLAADVVLGVQATGLLEQHLEDHLLDCWQADVPRTSLRRPLSAV